MNFKNAIKTLILITLFWTATVTAEVKIICVGDSIVALASQTSAPGRYGWGETLEQFFTDDIIVINRAIGGRSSKSYINEEHWEYAKAEKADYYFIEFGHNDQKSIIPKLYTDPETTYKDYLKQYITESREIGAIPVLITPLARRVYNSDGSINQSLLPYVNSMISIAAEYNVLVIDMFNTSTDYYEFLGSTESLQYGHNSTDLTHFGWMGATWCSRWITSSLLWSSHPDANGLKSYINFEIPNLVIQMQPSDSAAHMLSTDLKQWNQIGPTFSTGGSKIRFPFWIEHESSVFSRIDYEVNTQ